MYWDCRGRPQPWFSSSALSPLVRPEATLLSRNVELNLSCLEPQWGSTVPLPPGIATPQAAPTVTTQEGAVMEPP